MQAYCFRFYFLFVTVIIFVKMVARLLNQEGDVIVLMDYLALSFDEALLYSSCTASIGFVLQHLHDQGVLAFTGLILGLGTLTTANGLLESSVLFWLILGMWQLPESRGTVLRGPFQ